MSEFPCVVVDGVIFQYRLSGIARVWAALLREWKKSGFARNIVFLDRGGAYQGDLQQGNHAIRLERIKRHDFTRTGSDALALEEICRKVKADLFVSTFYTCPTLTPSLFFGYDMIPEVKGVVSGHEGWREKKRAILHAAAHLMISKSSARDLEELYQLRPGSTHVAYCGLLEKFYKPETREITNFRKKFAVGDGPYLLMVGERIGAGGYKNGGLVFNGVAKLSDPSAFTIICVGGASMIEPQLSAAAKKSRVLRLNLNDDDLRAAYGGAHALIYPSRYEGFGLPVIEAMACGAPVVTCRNSSLAEIADGAAFFVGEDDVTGLAQAIVEVGKPSVRERLVAEGLRRSSLFSFQAMAASAADALIETHRRLERRELPRPSLVWQDFREVLRAAQEPNLFVIFGRNAYRRAVAVIRAVGLDAAARGMLQRFLRVREQWTIVMKHADRWWRKRGRDKVW